MKKINLLLISTMLIVGCAKKVDPTPEVVETQPITESIEVGIVDTTVEVVNNTLIIETETLTETLVNTIEVVLRYHRPQPMKTLKKLPSSKKW